MKTEMTVEKKRQLANNNIVQMVQSEIQDFSRKMHPDQAPSWAFSQNAKRKVEEIKFLPYAIFDGEAEYIGLFPEYIRWTYNANEGLNLAKEKQKEMNEHRRQLESLHEAGLLPDVEAAFSHKYDAATVAEVEEMLNGNIRKEAIVRFDPGSDDLDEYFRLMGISSNAVCEPLQ